MGFGGETVTYSIPKKIKGQLLTDINFISAGSFAYVFIVKRKISV